MAKTKQIAIRGKRGGKIGGCTTLSITGCVNEAWQGNYGVRNSKKKKGVLGGGGGRHVSRREDITNGKRKPKFSLEIRNGRHPDGFSTERDTLNGLQEVNKRSSH